MTRALGLAYREEEGQALLQLLHEHPTEPLSVDTETTGLHVWDERDHAIGVSIAGMVEGQPVSHYFPLAHPCGDAVSSATRLLIIDILTDGRELIYANVQFDMASLLTAGMDVRRSDFYDVLTMHMLIDEEAMGQRVVNLDNLAHHWADWEKVLDPFIEKEKKTGNQNVTAEQMWEYAIRDAEATYAVWLNQIEHRNWVDLRVSTDVWAEKQELIRVLLEMRLRGVELDPVPAEEMVQIGRARMEELRESLGFNPGSNQQLAHVLIDVLGLPVLKRSPKTGNPSFDKSVMPDYDDMLTAMDNTTAKQLAEYRGWQKAVTASYEPYLREVSPVTGRIHAGFNTHRTVTGRLSSSEPNLQQVPKESIKPWNGRVKECFVAKPGYVLLSADYSQLELRLAAAYSGEPAILEVFADPTRDVFTEMSTQLGFTRDTTKTFVYSTQYGGGEKRIKTVFRVTAAQAKKMRSNYFATYPRFRAFNDACARKAEQNLKVKIWSGRYRHFKYKSQAYKAMNSVIQGGAADVVERVMIRAFRELDSVDCRLLLQVHDALVFEVREDLAEEYAARIKALMEDVNGAIGKELFEVRFNVEVSPWAKGK